MLDTQVHSHSAQAPMEQVVLHHLDKPITSRPRCTLEDVDIRNPRPGVFDEAVDVADCAPAAHNHQLGCTYYRTKRDWTAVQEMLNRWHNDGTPAEYYHVAGLGVSARHN